MNLNQKNTLIKMVNILIMFLDFWEKINTLKINVWRAVFIMKDGVNQLNQKEEKNVYKTIMKKIQIKIY